MAESKMDSPLVLPHAKTEDTCSLSEQINFSTRSSHTQLNRLILARLPLALPPYSLNPSTYAYGLLHIAPVYITFESLWGRILDESGNFSIKGSSQTYSILSRLHLPGLQRSRRLRADIKVLSGLSEQEVKEILHKISLHVRTSEFITHLTISVGAKPHVLLAYAWVMYMALFAGGRHLRAFLYNAGTDFWTRSPGQPPEKMPQSHTAPGPAVAPGLRFFQFPGEEDGEDIKRQFKERFAESETLLSHAEKHDIVQEAQHIFAFMVDLIGELDHGCGSIDVNLAETEKADVPTALRSQGNAFTAREWRSKIQASVPDQQMQSELSTIQALRVRAHLEIARIRRLSFATRFRMLGFSVRKATAPFNCRLLMSSPMNNKAGPLKINDAGTVLLFAFVMGLLSFLIWSIFFKTSHYFGF
ncbi:hypothetical protein BP5796_03883 [Coleophoma crateriformis]|uniref:Heme oxygenase-like protein n=1 Tax=Coleophoma crateriformis TaxID=565419 RepID=A0A3D8SIE6_9HELO|nr:hypothetical protein BP5796_03883 [Coleophoma crateriformis]